MTRIGVLCGGPSAEREISLRSGRAVYEALSLSGTRYRGNRYLAPLEVHESCKTGVSFPPSVAAEGKLQRESDSPIESGTGSPVKPEDDGFARLVEVVLVELSEDPDQIPDQIKQAQIDCAFIALHGPFGEDGTLQMLLEQTGIPYTGSSPEACRYAMDKVSCRRRWLAARLPVPRSVVAEPINAAERVKRLTFQNGSPFPVMVKPIVQGSSIGISLVERPEELQPAVEEAARYGEEILLEEYLPGSEVTVGILQDRPLPVIQIVPKRRFYDYVAKYTSGMTEYLVPAPLPKQTSRLIQAIAQRAHELLGCRSFSRVDLILVPGRGPVLLEINTIPGMTATSLLPKAAAAAGIDFPELCRRMLASAMDRIEVLG